MKKTGEGLFYSSVDNIHMRGGHHEADCSTTAGSQDLDSRSTDTELNWMCSHTNHHTNHRTNHIIERFRLIEKARPRDRARFSPVGLTGIGCWSRQRSGARLRKRLWRNESQDRWRGHPTNALPHGIGNQTSCSHIYRAAPRAKETLPG